MCHLKAWVAAQAGATLLALALLALFPPSDGRMMLLPLGETSQRTAISLAIAHGARLIGTGPLPGSVVIDGSRASLAAAMLRARIMILAAPSAGCGTTPADRTV